MQDFDNNFGAILRFDISTLPGSFKDIFATTVGATDCSKFLHRPEGITWGPAKGLYKEKLLYVTGYTDDEQSTPSVNNVANLLSSLQSSKHVQTRNSPKFILTISCMHASPYRNIKIARPA